MSEENVSTIPSASQSIRKPHNFANLAPPSAASALSSFVDLTGDRLVGNSSDSTAGQHYVQSKLTMERLAQLKSKQERENQRMMENNEYPEIVSRRSFLDEVSQAVSGEQNNEVQVESHNVSSADGVRYETLCENADVIVAAAIGASAPTSPAAAMAESAMPSSVSPSPKKRKVQVASAHEAAPKTTTWLEKESLAKDVWSCPVCFEDLHAEGMAPCGIMSCDRTPHMLCADCARDMITKATVKLQCPLCKKEFSARDVVPLLDLIRKEDALADARLEFFMQERNKKIATQPAQLPGADDDLPRIWPPSLRNGILCLRVYMKSSSYFEKGRYMSRLQDVIRSAPEGQATVLKQLHDLVNVVEHCVIGGHFHEVIVGRAFRMQSSSACIMNNDHFKKCRHLKGRKEYVNGVYQSLEMYIPFLFARTDIRINFVYNDINRKDDKDSFCFWRVNVTRTK